MSCQQPGTRKLKDGQLSCARKGLEMMSKKEEKHRNTRAQLVFQNSRKVKVNRNPGAIRLPTDGKPMGGSVRHRIATLGCYSPVHLNGPIVSSELCGQGSEEHVWMCKDKKAFSETSKESVCLLRFLGSVLGKQAKPMSHSVNHSY